MDINANKPQPVSTGDAVGLNCIENVKVTHTGDWLETRQISYRDPLGNLRKWESVGYTVTPKHENAVDCVSVVATLKRNLHHNCIVLVRQFRPPIGCYSIELPAGLCDKSDKNPQSTALRELLEETGYTGVVTHTDMPALSNAIDPGTESTLQVFVHVDINGDDPVNINCDQHLDDGEFIQVIVMPKRNLVHRLVQLVTDAKHKTIIDSRLYALALGMSMVESKDQQTLDTK